MTSPDALAARIAADVFRTDYAAPGFALIDRGTGLAPRDFRAELVALGQALCREYQRRHGEPLRFHSVVRFSQTTQTRPHRDGGPDASVLILGYEPSAVLSRVQLMDYSLAALQRGQTPREYLECCNPAFTGDAEALRPYAVEVAGFRPSRYQILVINNSQLPHEERHRGMLGLLHHARIDPAGPGGERYINSLQLGLIDVGLGEQELRDFVEHEQKATR